MASIFIPEGYLCCYKAAGAQISNVLFAKKAIFLHDLNSHVENYGGEKTEIKS
jgi:hypothetical protein